MNYYSQEINEVIKNLNSYENGLSEKEAKKRLLEFGHNSLPEGKVDNYFLILLRQFKSPLIYILIASGIIVLLMGENIDAIVIFFVLFMNAIVGAVQEGKAQNTFLALKKFIKGRATVLREGKEIFVSDREIVVGDIVVLREGDKVPADARLIQVNSLKVNEAALTGESAPKFKYSQALNKKNSSVMNQNNMVFNGTAVVSGSAIAVVTATGENTFLGQIAKTTLDVTSEFPLKKDIEKLSQLVILFVFSVGVFLFLFGWARETPLMETFKTVVAMAVSVIPEGLPIVMTLVLAAGVWRMSKKNVLIKKLQAVEVLGETRILAVDKTGTVTKNELIVEEVYSGGKNFLVTGSGYEPEGEISYDGNYIDSLNHQEILEAGKIAALSGSASVIFEKKKSLWRVSGDPTEGAMIVFSKKVGFHREELLLEMPLVDELPFDYKMKLHASLHKAKKGNLLVVTGSPEVLMERSINEWTPSGIKKITQKRKKELESIMMSMSQKGLRIIGFAYCETMITKLDADKLPTLVFGGFYGIKDTLRKEVRSAVKQIEQSGIKVVMITGDNEITAKTIAKDAGIYKPGDKILTGKELDALNARQLAKIIQKVSVFARVSPNDKLKIIQAYQSNGIVIAMTGDGVNDALSLTAADIGIGMGRIGTEVAKESSDIVLLDDNFGNISHGVVEGRNIFTSIKKVVLYLLSTSVGEVLALLIALILGMPLPILAAQILWLNLITDGFLDISLAMEKDERPKQLFFKRTFIIDSLMIKRMFFMATPMALGTIYLFKQYYQTDMLKAWTVSLTTLAVFQWFNAWNCRHEEKSIFQLKFFSNKYLTGATLIVVSLQFFALYNPFMQKILRTVPLNLDDWIKIIPIAFSIVAVEEARKGYFRYLAKK